MTTAPSTAKRRLKVIKRGVKHLPDWLEWRGRHAATVLEAVCLALNVAPSATALDALKRSKDPRINSLTSHIRTAVQWIDVPGGFPSVGPRQTPAENTEVGLAEFIAWLDHGYLVGLTPAPRLRYFDPPNPRAKSSTVGNVGIAPASANPTDGAESPPSGVAHRLVVGLLLAYIKDLAEREAHPPSELLTKKDKTLILSALAVKLQEQARHRTDQKTIYSDAKSGLSPGSLCDALRVGLDRLNPRLGDSAPSTPTT